MEFSAIFQDPKSDGQIENKNTPFYGKNVAIVGIFDDFNEEDLYNVARLLWEHGAIVTSHVTPFTDIVIKGASAEETDEIKIKEIKNKNNLRIFYQEDLGPILDEYRIKEWYSSNNVEEDFEYVAIDFEKLNDNKLSVCEVGLVVYKNGKEVDHFHSFINPVTGLERNSWAKCHLKHISDEELIEAPSFTDIFETIQNKILDNLIVVHSKGADLNYIYYLQDYYRLPKLYSKWADTKEIASYLGKFENLPNLYFQLFGTHNTKHHQALDDARACGMIFNYFCDEVDIVNFIHEEDYLPSEIKRSIDNNIRHTQFGTANVAPDGLVLNNDKISDRNFFKDKSVALSGMSGNDKDRIKSIIECLGARYTSAPSSKTDVFIINQNAVGPSKRIKAIELQKTTGMLIITDEYFWELVKM